MNLWWRIAVSAAVIEIVIDVLWGIVMVWTPGDPDTERGLLTALIAITLVSSIVVLLFGWVTNRNILPEEWQHRLFIVAPATAAAALEAVALVLMWASLGLEPGTIRGVLWAALVVASIGDVLSAWQTIRS